MHARAERSRNTDKGIRTDRHGGFEGAGGGGQGATEGGGKDGGGSMEGRTVERVVFTPKSMRRDDGR